VSDETLRIVLSDGRELSAPLYRRGLRLPTPETFAAFGTRRKAPSPLTILSIGPPLHR
jgi:hypothetical protein